jgi:very-short-patch-repair endonuclease
MPAKTQQPFPRNTARARSLRNSATITEKRLWLHLNKRQRQGFRFSRQIPVGPYFCDFLCREARLVVEVDGDSHDYTAGHDTRRDAFLAANGYRILRFQNDDVRDGLESVLTMIDAALLEWQAEHAHPGPAS